MEANDCRVCGIDHDDRLHRSRKQDQPDEDPEPSLVVLHHGVVDHAAREPRHDEAGTL